MPDPVIARPLRIGLPTPAWSGLSGARDLFQSLLNALIVDDRHQLILLAPEPDLADLHRVSSAIQRWSAGLGRLPTAMVRILQRSERAIRLRSLQSGQAIIDQRQRQAFAWLEPQLLQRLQFAPSEFSAEALAATARELQLDLLLPVVDPLDHPFVSYLYDCQHRRLPQNFSAEQIRKRDRHFTRLLRTSRALIVNSEDAKNDLIRFFDADPQAVFALPFAPPVIPEWLADRSDLLQPYHLPERFFLVSNQFWRHKSLETVVEALKILHQRGHRQVQVLFTGCMEDPRFPDYPDSIVALSQQLDLGAAIQFLGFIPKRDQIELLKHSVAVIQPTLFEGGRGGGSVIDAAGLGVRAIVSDIAVNKELPASCQPVFFKAADAADLADAMWRVWQDRDYRRSPDEVLIRRNAEQVGALANTLYQAIARALTPAPAATISVIINASGSDAELQTTIASVRHQTHPHTELLVIDPHAAGHDAAAQPGAGPVQHIDGSSLSRYQAMNRAASAASGELLQFLEAGDQLADAQLLAQVTALFASHQTWDVGFVYGDLQIGAGAQVAGRRIDNQGFDFSRYLDRGQGQQACIYRRELFLRSGGFDHRLRYCGDHELNARLSIEQAIASHHIDTVIANCKPGGPATPTPERQPALQEERKQIARRYFGDHFPVIKRYIDEALARRDG